MKPGSRLALIAPLACIMLALAAGHGLGAVDVVGTVPAAGAPAGGTSFTMQPGMIAHRGLELTGWITKPGTYQISYRAGGAVANALSLTVVDGDR